MCLWLCARVSLSVRLCVNFVLFDAKPSQCWLKQQVRLRAVFVFSIPIPPTVAVTPRASLVVSGRAAQTGHLLSPTNQAPQQHISKLRAPQQGRSSSVAPAQGSAAGANGVPAALASNGSDPHSNGGGARGDARGESAGADSGDDTIATLTKIVRQKNATIQVGGWVGGWVGVFVFLRG